MIDKKPRDAVLDSIKGFLIILVVFGHLIETSSNALAGKLYQIIYAFHMPCFVFIAGINAKSDVKSILIRIRNLSVLTVIWIGIYSLYVYKTQGNTPDPLTPFWIMWFMVSLISWNILLLGFKYFHYSIAIFCALLVSIFSASIVFLGYKYSALRTLYFLNFFVIGYFISRENSFKRVTNFFKGSATAYILIAIGLMVIGYLASISIDRRLLYGSFRFEQLGMDIASGALQKVALILCSLALISLIFLIFYKFNIKTFARIGKYSLTIYLFHGMIILSLRKELNLNSPEYISIFLSLFLTFLICSTIVIVSSFFNKSFKSKLSLIF